MSGTVLSRNQRKRLDVGFKRRVRMELITARALQLKKKKTNSILMTSNLRCNRGQAPPDSSPFSIPEQISLNTNVKTQ